MGTPPARSATADVAISDRCAAGPAIAARTVHDRGLPARADRTGDEALLEWAGPELPVHVLLSKSDKLNRSEAARVLREVSQRLADRATVQLFSVPLRIGLDEAQRTLEAWLTPDARIDGNRRNKKPR